MLQKRTNLAIFSAVSQSIWPEPTALLLATKPTTWPPSRPKAVTASRARSGWIS